MASEDQLWPPLWEGAVRPSSTSQAFPAEVGKGLRSQSLEVRGRKDFTV